MGRVGCTSRPWHVVLVVPGSELSKAVLEHIIDCAAQCVLVVDVTRVEDTRCLEPLDSPEHEAHCLHTDIEPWPATCRVGVRVQIVNRWWLGEGNAPLDASVVHAAGFVAGEALLTARVLDHVKLVAL